MKDLKRIAVTVGIGSAMALLLSRVMNRVPLAKTGKQIRKIIKPESCPWDEDNNMRYI